MAGYLVCRALREHRSMDAEDLRQRAQREVLDGLASGKPVGVIEQAVAACHVRRVYMPDVAMLELVIAALDVGGVDQSHPLDMSDARERFLPEFTFRNRPKEVDRLVYAVQTAAAFRTGLRPDILDDTYSWGSVSLLPYATRAAVMTIRAIAAGRDIAEACAQVAGAIRPLAPEQAPNQ